MLPRPPSARVLRAFGVGPPVRRLPGGQGTSWMAGNLVLKPGGGREHEWAGETLGCLSLDDVRVAQPVVAIDGAWTVDGWAGTRFVAGSEPDLSSPSTLMSILHAGRAFHRGVAHLSRPGFLDLRDNPWAAADRVAWGERMMPILPRFAHLAARMRSQPDPSGRPQVVHGDLTGNVLFASGLPPAVVDVSPYWRPPSYAEGVVVADALCWHGADASTVEMLGVPVPAVARALLFRMATTNALVTAGTVDVDLEDEARRYERAALILGI